jgi:hypothetical protein
LLQTIITAKDTKRTNLAVYCSSFLDTKRIFAAKFTVNETKIESPRSSNQDFTVDHQTSLLLTFMVLMRASFRPNIILLECHTNYHVLI